MTYIEIRSLLKANNLEVSASLDIVSCVCASLGAVEEEVSDEKFNLICRYVRKMWDDTDKSYTQLMADVVVDCVYHCFGYYQCEDITLTDNDLRDVNKLDEVINIYLDKYYD